LRKDKLRGVHQQRRQQNELFARWLRKQPRPKMRSEMWRVEIGGCCRTTP